MKYGVFKMSHGTLGKVAEGQTAEEWQKDLIRYAEVYGWSFTMLACANSLPPINTENLWELTQNGSTRYFVGDEASATAWAAQEICSDDGGKFSVVINRDHETYADLQRQLADLNHTLNPNDESWNAAFVSVFGQMESVKNRNGGYAPGTEPS